MRKKQEIISKVYDFIREERAEGIDRNSVYSRGFSMEGYDGGYLQALSDIQLFMNDVIPNSRYKRFWENAFNDTFKTK